MTIQNSRFWWHWHIPLFMLCCLVFIGGCDREPRDWERATTEDTSEGYEQYLKIHPQGTHADSAADRIEWRSASDANTVEALSGYLLTHGEFAGEASSALLRIAIHQSITRLELRSADLGNVWEQATKGRLRPDPDLAAEQRYLEILAEAVQAFPAEVRIAISEVMPLDGPPLVAVPRLIPEATIVSTFEKTGVNGLEVTGIGKMVLGASNRLADALTVGKGAELLTSAAENPGNVQAYVSVRQQHILNRNQAVLFTELPEEGLPYSFGNGGMFTGQTTAVLPMGNGSIYRIHDGVEGLFDGYVFESTAEVPMTFVLLRDSGLTLIDGSGRVSGPNGEQHELRPNFRL